MRKEKLFIFLCLMLMLTLNLKQSWSQDLNQEEDYRRAQFLLEKGKLEEALSLFSKLSTDNPSDLKIRLGVINTRIEKARVLKVRRDLAWKDKIYIKLLVI